MRTDIDLWICRKCTTDGKYHTSVDFLMSYHKITFAEAIHHTSVGAYPRHARGNGLSQPPRSAAPIQVLPDKTWQAEAWKEIDGACTSILEHKTGKTCWEYLTKRGISRGSIFMHLLGYAVIYGRPAIVIPYLDVGEVVTAIKYRFVDELAQIDKGKRFAMKAGSLPYLFGLQHVLSTDDTLLFVEGEINAISILQTLPRGVSVISAGSENNGNVEILNALAAHYARVVIWMDEEQRSEEIYKRMSRPDAKLLKSPFIEQVKWDANEMLRNGLLHSFLTRQLLTVCDGIL